MIIAFSARRTSLGSRGLLSRGVPALVLVLVLLLGGGFNFLTHHDHSILSSDTDCMACRVLETPVEATPLQTAIVSVDAPRVEYVGLPATPELPAAPYLTLDRLRGPPQA